MTSVTRRAAAVAVTGVLVFLLLLTHSGFPSVVTRLDSGSSASNHRATQYKRVAAKYTNTGSNFHNGAGNNNLSTGGSVHNGAGNNDLSTGGSVHNGAGNNDLSTGSNFHNGAGNNDLSTGSSSHNGAGNNDLSTGESVHNGAGNNDLSTGGSVHNGAGNNDLSTGESVHNGAGNNDLSTGSSSHNGASNNDLSTGRNFHNGAGNNDLSTGSSVHIPRRDPLANNIENSPLLPSKAAAEVEKFVFFIGYRRSGHSIIGSMLDAHPDIVIAHEFFLFKKLIKFPELSQSLKQRYKLFAMLYHDSYMEAAHGARTIEQDAKGYNLELKNSWQGRFRRLKVIGEKGGSNTVKVYRTAPELFEKYYQQLLETIQVPVKVFHVVRNPYDIIATDVLYAANNLLAHQHLHTKLPASATKKYDNETLLMARTASLFENARAIVEMVRKFKMNVLELHNEDLIADPKNTIQRVCKFLEVECSADYLQQCSDKTFKSVSKSRDFVFWPDQVIAMVEQEKQKYPFFQRYTFHED